MATAIQDAAPRDISSLKYLLPAGLASALFLAGSRRACEARAGPWGDGGPSGDATAMKTIFVMIKCELGKSYDVAGEAVESIEQVSEVYSISGEWDLLLKAYLEETDDIGHFVTQKLQKLKGIKDTFTLVTFNAFT
jgi:DNA-binding Lrp family transcriptional regulator